MAAVQPTTPNTRERLDYVYRGYAEPGTQRLGFAYFVKMVRDIQLGLGRPTSNDSVHNTARDVFDNSNIDVETGVVERSNFIDACVNEAFRGTRKLLRLISDVHDGSGDELDFASPKARRLSMSDAPLRVGSPGHVHIRRTAVSRLGVVPHSPATKHKINESLLEAPSPAAGVPDDHMDSVNDVLDKMLDHSYVAPPHGHPYDLMTVGDLLATIHMATTAFAAV